MRIYDIDGNDLINTSKSNLCFKRQYSYLDVECEQGDIDTSTGEIISNANRCVIHLPNVGCVEVRQFAAVSKFKIMKVSNGTVSTLTGNNWSYYTYRYIGDPASTYYAVVASATNDSSAITPSGAMTGIAVYSFTDIGIKTDFQTSLNGKHIAVIGDSITQGRFRKMSNSSIDWEAPIGFTGLIGEQAGDMNYGNFGIGGALVSGNDWKSLLVNCSKVTGYDVVFVCGGTNDYGGNVSSTTFTNAYSSVVDTLKSNNTEVVCCSPVYRTSKTGKNSAGLDLKDYCNLIKNVAQVKNCKYIELYDPTNDGKFITYCPDGLHPNEIGHKIMADIILEEYEKLNA